MFLEILKGMLAKGKSSGSFSKEQWDVIAALYREKSGDDDVDQSNLQHRLKTLKKKYNLNSLLRLLDGWSWDNNLNMVIAPNDKAWEEKIGKNPDYVKVKNKPFPQYNLMHSLFGKAGDGSSVGNLPQHIDYGGSIGKSEVQFGFPSLNPETEGMPPIAAIPVSARRAEGVSSSCGKRRRSVDIKAPPAAEEANIESLFSLQKQLLEMHRDFVSLRENALVDGVKEEAEKAEGLKMMKALPGLPRHYLAAGTTALQKKELRQCILMLEGEDLAVWLQQQFILSMSAANPILLQEMTRDGPILSQPAKTPANAQSAGQVQEQPNDSMEDASYAAV